MLHDGSVLQVQTKGCCFMFTYTFFKRFLGCFSSKNLRFFHFHFFFNEVSNLCDRILANQKQELVIRNCQWNCIIMLKYDKLIVSIQLIIQLILWQHYQKNKKLVSVNGIHGHASGAIMECGLSFRKQKPCYGAFNSQSRNLRIAPAKFIRFY